MIKSGRFQSLHFEVTHKCNLRCKHCYNIDYLTSNSQDLSLEEVKKVIDIAKGAGCTDMGFSGGEPFMRADMVEIIEYVKEYPIHILTNGLLIDEKLVARLNAIDNLLLELRISMDGLESHQMMRNVSYKEVLKHIKLLLENEYVVTVNTMVTDQNLDELERMYDLFKSVEIDRWRLDFIFNSGNADTNQIRYRNRRKMFDTLKKLVRRYMDERPPFEFDINKIFRSVLLANATTWKYTLDTKPCEYQGGMTVRPNGEVSFCPSLCLTHGNILTDGLEGIMHQKTWKEFSNIRVKDIDPKCLTCKYVSYCGGGCRADGYYDTNSLYGISDFTCELIEFYVCEIMPMIEEYKTK